MNHASQLTTGLFIALVGALAAIAVRAFIRAGRAGGLIAGGALLFYLIVPALLARAGVLDRYTPLPAPALVLVLAVTVTTVVVSMSAFGLRLAATVGMTGLVGFQAFRIPVEWLLHRLFTEGVIPVQMTYAGRNFDIVSGLTAAGLGLWLSSGRSVSRAWLLVWNVVGLALLVNIVVIAVLSTPVPFRQFLNDPPNLLPSTFPFVWLPTFLVQAALFGHLLVFRSIRTLGPTPRASASGTRHSRS
jgi:hypothetical protein